MPRTFAFNFEVWDRLISTLYESRGHWVAYVYRLDRDGRAVRPYLTRCEASKDLPMMRRDEFGGGEFEILIRQGRRLKFAGRIAVESFRRRGSTT